MKLERTSANIHALRSEMEEMSRSPLKISFKELGFVEMCASSSSTKFATSTKLNILADFVYTLDWHILSIFSSYTTLRI